MVHGSFQIVFETNCFVSANKLGLLVRLKTEKEPASETGSEYENWLLNNSQSTETKHHEPPSKAHKN
jgi:hypothetical protein